MTWWSVAAFIGGLLIPDPWTLLRIARYRKVSWDALIGVDRFRREALVYVKRRTAKPAQLVLSRGRFYLMPRRKAS